MLVFLIHAHANVGQLNRLIGLLAGDQSIVYVNLDRKSAIDPGSIDPRARLVRRRIDIHWSDWSQVEATLNSLQEIEAAHFAYSHVVFLSGEDYPVRDVRYMCETLDPAHDYIDYAGVLEHGWAWQSRYTKFHAGSRPLRVAFRAINRIAGVLGRERSVPGGMVPYAGSAWWNLTQGTVRQVLAYVRANPGVVRFYRYTSCPDEMFFQTIVKHVANESTVARASFRYIRFTGAASRPEILDLSHAEPILASDALFIRKVRDPESLPLLRQLSSARGLPFPAEVAPSELLQAAD